MPLYSFPQETYIVYYNDDKSRLRYKKMVAGTAFDVPDWITVEQFTNETEARTRAEELGYIFDPELEDDD